MDKVRKLGWNGYVDSYESMLETFDQLAELKMIPPIPKVKVSFSSATDNSSRATKL